MLSSSSSITNKGKVEETDENGEVSNKTMSESKELLVQNEKEQKSEADSKEDDVTTESSNAEDDPLQALLETEGKFLAKQEEMLEQLIMSEKEMENNSGVMPCKSCTFPDPILATTSTFCFGLCSRSFSRYGGIRELWIVSAPGNDTPQETFDKLNTVTEKKKLSKNYKFHIPELKVGTINELMPIIDGLQELDFETEDTLNKLASFMAVIVKKRKTVMEYLLANNMDLASYLTKFTWNVEKYPMETPLHEIFKSISQTVDEITADLKERSEEHGDLESTLQRLERDRMENLLTRPLDDLVKKEDFVTNSEYLTTLLVVIANEDVKKWLNKYETLIDMVVPKSSIKIFSDKTHSLYTVVVATKFAEDFETAARQNKFTIRSSSFVGEKMSQNEEYLEKMVKIREAIIAASFRWLKVKFSECFVAWTHIKALRVFAESVIRFGIPTNFQATLLIPLKSKKLKRALDNLYEYIESVHGSGSVPDIPGGLTQFDVKKYMPYVLVTVRTDFKQVKKE